MRRVSMGLRCGAGVFALVVGSAAAAQSVVPPADVTNAQASTSNQNNGEEIVVTGSRIRRDPLAQESPVVFVDKSDMLKTGLNSVTDVLQRLPSVGGGLNGKFNTSGNNGNPPDGAGVGAGAAEIDLRYLGSKRTLVLVDGMRFVNGASASGVPGSVDLNAIPESMIERVEVLQDGASAIYGSDAIAGVVNIITKRGQDGLELSAQLGEYDKGDGFSQNYQASWGNGRGGPTQIVVGANYVKQNPVFAGDRDISAFPTPYGTSCLDGGCSSATLLGRFIVLGNNITLRGPVIGRVPVYNPANPTDPASDFKAFTAADRFNFAPFNYILTPLERFGGFVNLTQELGATTKLNVKVLANRRQSKNQAAPLPLFVGPDAGNGNLLDTIVIDATNPYNPFGQTLDASNYNFIGRRVIEGGPRRYNQRTDTIYGTATLDGRLPSGWFWDINALWGKNKAKQTMFGNINAARLQQALGPVANCTGSCVPFNIFGGQGSITQAMLDYVGFTQRDSSQQNLWGFSGNLSGKLADLPGGDLGLAAGVEYRELKGRFDPDATVAAGLGSDIPALPTKGGYNLKEVYGEVKAPLFEQLELSGAVRYSVYSTSGSKATYKLGLNFTPIKDIRLRASLGTGFRAPSIGELFGSRTRFDQQLTDPCSASQNPTGNVLANCQANGVPPGYEQNNPQISVVTGGNPNLKAESSNGFTIGGVISPVALNNRVSLEVNYYQVHVKGAIQQVDAATILNNCVLNGDALACAAIPRTASGQITQIQGVLQNIAAIKTAGLDINFAARTGKQSFGELGFTSNNSILKRFDQFIPTASGVQKITRDGTEVGSPYQGFPKFKSVNSIDWNMDSFGATVTGRYISHLTEGDGHRIASRFYTDAQIRWNPGFMHDLGLALGVNNVFDKDPPVCTTCGIPNYDPNLYDIPGRYIYGRISLKMK